MPQKMRRLRFEYCLAVVREVVKAGLKACTFAAHKWILETEAVSRCVANTKERIGDSLWERIDETREILLATRELIRIAASRIGYFAEAASALIGGTTDTSGAPLTRRRTAAARALDRTSGRHFQSTYEPTVIEQLAESLYQLLTRPMLLMEQLQTAAA